MNDLDLEPSLSPLRQEIVRIYQKGFGAKAVERCARHTCHQIGEVLKTTHFEDDHMRGKLSEISRNCSEGV